MTRLECLRHAISTASGLPWAEIASARRAAKYITPRWVAGVIMKERMNMSFSAIGRRMGRDHSSIIHGFRKVKAIMASPYGAYARNLYAAANKALDDMDANKPVFVDLPVEETPPVAELPKACPANVIGIRRPIIIDSLSKAVGRVDDAARHLRCHAPVYRCNDLGVPNQGGKLWRYGNRIMTDAALVELAERKGWRRFDELAA